VQYSSSPAKNYHLEETGEEVDRGWGENFTHGSIYGSVMTVAGGAMGTGLPRQMAITYEAINFSDSI
jgi:hypothetical protein